MRWGEYWKLEPPIQEQNKTLLINLNLLFSASIGHKMIPSDLLPHLKAAEDEEVEQQADIDLWTLHFSKRNAKVNNASN